MSQSTPAHQPPALHDRDLPALFAAADAGSLTAQGRFKSATGATLALSVLGALCGAVASGSPSLEPVAIGGAVAFLVGVFVGVFLLLERPERLWYGGRAVAESVEDAGLAVLGRRR